MEEYFQFIRTLKDTRIILACPVNYDPGIRRC